MQDTKQIVIGKKEFWIKQLPCLEALNIFIRVVKHFKLNDISQLTLLFAETEGEESDSFMMILNLLMANIDEQETPLLLKETLESSVEVPKSFNFDNDFKGDYITLFKLFYEILAFNLGDEVVELKKKLIQ